MHPIQQNTDNPLRILLTGGHAATTGISVVQEIRRKKPDAEIFWVGTKSAIAGSKFTTLEHKIYPSMGVKYYEIKSGKLQTKFTRHTIPLTLMIPFGFFQALFLILKIRPSVILSFGGSASFPVVFWSWVLGIPVILHEQTVVAGRAAIASARLAKKVALGRMESAKYFPPGKVVVTGNPLMKEILSLKPKVKPGYEKTILVMGGSRGSEFINEEFIKIVPDLLDKYRIIHITGERDYEKYKRQEKDNYKVLPFVVPTEMYRYYDMCDLIISRAGANSVSEIIYTKRPAILIPLPRTFMDEQIKNAEYAKRVGLATVLTEKEVNPRSLITAIENSFKDWQKIAGKVAFYKSPDVEASGRLLELVLSNL